MLNNFTIVHRRKPNVFTELQAPVWATCLRSLAFIRPQDSITLMEGDEKYSGKAAYQFLLEIVCGLQSPIVGETEVFGQFKTFMQEWLREQPDKTVLAQRVLSDAKTLRSQHLKSLGNQSYGSWLRKNLKSNTVHILGGGQLAREILPYISKQNKKAVVHVREPSKVDFHQDVRTISSRQFCEGALVIAAPMSAEEIQRWLGGAQPKQIFDLRDNSCTDIVQNAAEHHGLKQIFNQIEKNRSRLIPVIETVRADIIERAEKLHAQALVRPQGWDDLCA